MLTCRTTIHREIAEDLGLYFDFTPIKTGITYDSSSFSWKRVGDGLEVVDLVIDIDYGDPDSNSIIYWLSNWSDEGNPVILNNYEDYGNKFICERQL